MFVGKPETHLDTGCSDYFVTGPFFTVLVLLFLIVGEIAILGGVGEQNEKLWNFTQKASHIQLDR